MVKALLVGVSNYFMEGCSRLPLCRNDLIAMRKSLIKGLNVNEQNIWVCGEAGVVTKSELFKSMQRALKSVNNDDTFIFYFSGHGAPGELILSDGIVNLQELLNGIQISDTKNKIAIIDSCYSGDFTIGSAPEKDFEKSLEQFIENGFAVMASCGASQISGFSQNRSLGLYTSFVCDALNSRFLIKEGKKSLEDINEAIFRYAEVYKKNKAGTVQNPIFRSNIGGTIYFDVEEYTPYKQKKIYEECDNYIIYDVEPVHHAGVKRLSVKVILRYLCSVEETAEIANEVKDKILYSEVHKSKISEQRYFGKAANIVWCYFGYDEDDIINSNYAYQSTWVDETQEQGDRYHKSNDAAVIQGIYIKKCKYYESLKNTISNDELIQITRKYTKDLISSAEKYIVFFREYQNKTLMEKQLVENVASINEDILTVYMKQGDLPLPTKELYDWSEANTNLANDIHDLSLYYNKNFMSNWTRENREKLTVDTIKRYEKDLKLLKDIEQVIIC